MRYTFLVLLLLLTCSVAQAQTQTTLSLQDALSMALKNNPFYKTQKYNVELAKTAVTTAGLHPNPSAGISSLVVPSSRYYAPGTGFLAPDNRQMTYQLSKPFQVGGQLRYKVQFAKSDLALATSSLDEYGWTLLNDVALKWLDVWYADEKLKLIELAKLNSDTLLGVNQIRLKNQVITTTEYTRTQINAEQYRLMQLSASQELKSEQNNLALMLGLKDKILTDNKEQWFPAVLPQDFDTLLQTALENRKEIQMGKQMTEKAKADVALQKAIAKPVPEIGMNYSPQNRVPYMGLFVAVPLPVFDRNQGEITRAKIAIEQAEATTDAFKLQVTKEVRNAFDEYTTNRNSWERYKELNKKSENVLQTVKISYLKGGTTILDYLEAERTWFEMQNQYYEAMFNFRKSYLQLLFTCNYNINI